MPRMLKWTLASVLALVLAGAAYVAIQLQRRPSVAEYPMLPPAPPEAPIRVRFAGVGTLLFDDGETAWLVDGFFSRPAYARLLFSRITPDLSAIDAGLAKLGVHRLAAVVPGHSHYDHAMDAPLVALKTGALLIGSPSTLNIGRGLGLPEQRMREVIPNEQVVLGRWTLTFIAGRHVPLAHTRDGVVTIDAPLIPPARALAWGEGQTWLLLVEHSGGARMLVANSAGFVPDALTGRHADTVFLGIAGLAQQTPDYRAQWWQENVLRVGARRVIPLHWDDFGRSLDQPLVAFPYLIDDIGATLSELSDWSARDGVELRLPPAFTPFEP